jgi:hypothetical protein
VCFFYLQAIAWLYGNGLVDKVGGYGWWIRLVDTVGGFCWWIRLVDTVTAVYNGGNTVYGQVV